MYSVIELTSIPCLTRDRNGIKLKVMSVEINIFFST